MLDITIYAIPVFLVCMIVESVFTSRRRMLGYTGLDTWGSLAMGVGNALIDLVMKGVHYAWLSFCFGYALLELDASSAPVWIVALIATDFMYYWFHRLHHEVRFLWAAHVNHHTSRHYNFSTALRQSWTTPFTSLLFYWPLALVGFDPKLILAMSAINTVYQFWVHTEAVDRIGPLEWILNTPSHHRVHHGSNVQYMDRNHGGMLIVWDRLFGTFEPECVPVVYGITKNIDTYNPVEIAFHEWRDMLGDAARPNSLAVRLGYLVRPPGWSPDGATCTSGELRAGAGIAAAPQWAR